YSLALDLERRHLDQTPFVAADVAHGAENANSNTGGERCASALRSGRDFRERHSAVGDELVQSADQLAGAAQIVRRLPDSLARLGLGRLHVDLVDDQFFRVGRVEASRKPEVAERGVKPRYSNEH